MPPIWLTVIILFGNVWIWRIFKQNFFIFLLLIIFTILLYVAIRQRITLIKTILFFILLITIIVFQYKTTTRQSLSILDNDEQRVQQIRLQAYVYDPDLIKIIFFRFKLRDFYEGSLNIVITRLQRNFFETIDLNIYFFGGHPRGRVWSNDFEKFSFILLPLFLIGLLTYRIKQKLLSTIIITCIFVLTLIGHKNNLGPFLLLPFLVLYISFGAYTILNYTKKFHKIPQRYFLIIILLTFLLSLIQSIAYAS